MFHQSKPLAISWRRLAPILWMTALYLATAANEILHVGPEDPLLFEAQQIAVHTVSYAVQAWLLARAIAPTSSRKRLALIALTLTIGVGQEALQSLIRGDIAALGSLVDLIVDGVGAVLGLWLAGWRHCRETLRGARTT